MPKLKGMLCLISNNLRTKEIVLDNKIISDLYPHASNCMGI